MSTNPEKPNLATGDEAALSSLLLPLQADDHVQGPAEARNTIVEYGDYECPACGALFLVLHQLCHKLGDGLRIAYRHYPLSGLHPEAQLAAEAAEAADAQGHFWQMHDLLFEHQSALAQKQLISYAEQLSLDMKAFRDALRHRTYEDRVREDFRRGVTNGVYGTPGLFINGVRYSGPLETDALLARLVPSE